MEMYQMLKNISARDFPNFQLPIFNQPKQDQIYSFSQNIIVSMHHFYLSKEIEELDSYIDLMNTLKSAEQHDTIFIYISSPGGNLNTAFQIINGIKSTNATVVTVMDGHVCSCATLIFLSGHKQIIFPDGIFMIHTMSYNPLGKEHEVYDATTFHRRWWAEICQSHYKEFLTAEEILAVIEGKDLYFTSTEVAQRLSTDLSEKDEVTLENISEKIPELIESYLSSRNKQEVQVVEDRAVEVSVSKKSPLRKPKPKKK